jgi:serine/threonine protein kinase/tetratricopeptide (TPR) repeat protein
MSRFSRLPIGAGWRLAAVAVQRNSDIVSLVAMGTPGLIGPYRIIAPLGSGGMGVVYRAEHVESGTKRAVKTVKVPYGSDMAGLRSEIHALTRIHHPGIVRIVGEGQHEGLPWYAMELIEGRPLDLHFRDRWNGASLGARPSLPPSAASGEEDTMEVPGLAPPLPTPRAQANNALAPAIRWPAAAGHLRDELVLIRKLCAPLAFLHRAGIVHRDLKPANVLVRDGGEPVLMDFGLVSRFASIEGREVIQVAGEVRGTVAYMSPEQIRGQLVDARSDLYSLGCILYEAVCGRVPFAGEMLDIMGAHVAELPMRPSLVVSGVSPALEELILKLLAKEPRARYGYADDVAGVLDEILGEPPQVRDPGAGDYLYRPEIAGRAEVLAQLTDQVLRIPQGSGGFALLGGESGVGKTCVAQAVAREVRLRQLRVVTGDCLPVATPELSTGWAHGAPLHPFRGLLETIADYCRENGPEAGNRILGPRGKVLAQYEPALARVPGQEQFPDPPEIPAQAARLRILNALGETLAAFAATRPLLLVLDDLQWADELTLDFLQLLDETFFVKLPVYVLGTYRLEETSEALQEVLRVSGVTRIELKRLDQETVGAIVADMLAMNPPPDALVHVLHRRSEGNPFFVAELLRTAVAERLLYREQGAWRVVGGHGEDEYEALPLPGSLRDLVGRRLDGLSEPARALVEVAAVLGREVDGEILRPVSALGDADALGAVKELLSHQVVEEVRAGRFRFVHDKLREIAYARIPDERRRALHRGAAQALEARHDNASLLYAELAHHFRQAGDVDQAIAYLEKAGDQAQKSFANREAARCFSDAIELDAQAQSRVPVLRRAAWLRQRSLALFCLGRLQESLAGLHDAVAGLGWPVPETSVSLVLRLLGRAFKQLLHRLLPRRWLGRRSAAQRQQLLEATRCYDLLMPVTYFATGHVLRILYATLSNLNLAESAGAAPELALAYANAHVTAGLLPWLSLAEAYGEWAHQALEEVADPAVRSWVYVLCGSYCAGVGKFDQALKLGERAVQIAEEVGFERRVEEALGVMGATYNLRGDFVRGRDTSHRIWQLAQRGDPQTTVWGSGGESQNCSQLAEPERALEAARRAQAASSSDKLGRPERILGHGPLALAWLRAGKPAEARAAAETGLREISDGAPMAFYCITAYSCVADVLLALWEGGDASVEKAACRAVREVGRSARIFPVHRPHAWIYRGRMEAQLGRIAQARRCWERALSEARAREMPHAEGLAELEMARRMPAGSAERRAGLERARARFAASDARYDVRCTDAEMAGSTAAASGATAA